jgi:hypothetical protein
VNRLFTIGANRLGSGLGRPAVKTGIAEAAVEAASSSPGFIVHLNTGVLLELPVGADPSWVGRLVRELRAR